MKTSISFHKKLGPRLTHSVQNVDQAFCEN